MQRHLTLWEIRLASCHIASSNVNAAPVSAASTGQVSGRINMSATGRVASEKLAKVSRAIAHLREALDELDSAGLAVEAAHIQLALDLLGISPAASNLDQFDSD